MGVGKRLHQSLRNRHATPTLRMRSVMAVRCACLRTFLDFGLSKSASAVGRGRETSLGLRHASPGLRRRQNPSGCSSIQPMLGLSARITCRLRLRDRQETQQPVPDSPGPVARLKVWRSLPRYARSSLETVSSRRIDQLHIVGGGSQNQLLNQFAANSLQIPILAGPADARFWVMCWCKRLRWATCLRGCGARRGAKLI